MVWSPGILPSRGRQLPADLSLTVMLLTHRGDPLCAQAQAELMVPTRSCGLIVQGVRKDSGKLHGRVDVFSGLKGCTGFCQAGGEPQEVSEGAQAR